jgi:hypothetical protein
MKNPRRLAFPCVVDPWTKKECLVLLVQVIADARAGIPPSYIQVLGYCPADGQKHQFAVPLAEYQRAERELVNFIEVDNIAAPKATIVDPRNGKAFRS